MAVGADYDRPIQYRLLDDSRQRSLARAQAIARARAMAEDHAAVLGMRVGRIIRISERSGIPAQAFDAYRTMLSALGGSGVDDRRIRVSVEAAVDFALVPR